ncbi:hypothetical protein NMG60_11025324 [Bertholletia excelsa]
MLRKRSAATSKQALMAEYGSFPSPTSKYRRPTSSIFSSSRLFTSFVSKGFTETDSILSPTSILDTKPFSAFRNPFWSDQKSPKPEARTHWDKLDSGGVGLGIVDCLESDLKLCKPKSRNVLFASQLRVQIPPIPSTAPSSGESPKSPADFGIKTRNSQMGPFSPSPGKKSPFGSVGGNPNTPRALSAEMELSEDYTCVISYGPNPRTTHIFDDCVVESCLGVAGLSSARKENEFGASTGTDPFDDFLSFCYSCKKDLGHGKDIYIYRGEKAFCSSECRDKVMVLEEGMGKLET